MSRDYGHSQDCDCEDCVSLHWNDAPEDDGWADLDYGCGWDDDEEPIPCHQCKGETIGDGCEACGVPLCPDCYSGGGAFCAGPHTEEDWAFVEERLRAPEEDTP